MDDVPYEVKALICPKCGEEPKASEGVQHGYTYRRLRCCGFSVMMRDADWYTLTDNWRQNAAILLRT